jgi:hypothetical protein
MNIRTFLETYEYENKYKRQISTEICSLIRTHLFLKSHRDKFILLNEIKGIIMDSIKSSQYNLSIKVHMLFYFYKIEEGLTQICYNRSVGTRILLDDLLTCIIISSMWDNNFPFEITKNFLETFKKNTT